MWTVQNAKAQLSEILRLARAGEPQVIGTSDSCVVISSQDYETLSSSRHYGRWLVENAPKDIDAELELPPRKERRGDPFAAN